MKTKNHLHSLPLKKWQSSQWEVVIQNRPITPEWQRLRIPPLLPER